MNIILKALVRRIWQRAYLDTEEECARWIEEYIQSQQTDIKPGIGGPGSEVRSDGEQLGNEAGATKPVRRFENCYIRNKIGCHCTDECGYEAVMRGTP